MANDPTLRLAFPGVVDPSTAIAKIVRAKRTALQMMHALVRIEHDDLLPLLGDLPADETDRQVDKRTIDGFLSRFKPLRAQQVERLESLHALQDTLDRLISHAKQTQPELLLKVFESRYEELKTKSERDTDEVDWLVKEIQELNTMLPGGASRQRQRAASTPRRPPQPAAPAGRRTRQKRAARGPKSG